MQIDLSTEDVRFLADQLTRDLRRLESELGRDDENDLERAHAHDVERLKGLIARFKTPRETSLAV